MTGLEFYQEIRRNWPKVRFIFLTGYMDFEYVYVSAQDAHTRFLTKLESVEKITDTVWEVLEEIELSYREKEVLQKAQVESKLAQPILLNKAIGHFIFQTVSIEQQRNEFEKLAIHINLSQEVMFLGATLDAPTQEFNVDEVERLGFVLKTLLSNYFKGKFVLYQYLSEQQNMPYTWILQGYEDTSIKAEEILECVQNAFANSVDATISFAYGFVQPEYKDNSKMHRRIQNMLGYRDPAMIENIIPCNVKQNAGSRLVDQKEVKVSWEQLEYVSELDSFMELGKEAKFFIYFERMVKHLPEVSSMNNPLAQEIYYRIAVLLLRYINMWQLHEKMAFEMEMYKLMRVEMHDNWQQAVAFLRESATTLFRLNFKEEQAGISNYVVLTKAYIRENLGADLNLVVLAEAVHLNTSYLSRLFHKETGEKLYDYISNLRMKKAKEQIMQGTRKIQDIAKEVGYESVQSFNRAFKKNTGVSPLDYRAGLEDKE
jgi:two-component system response regulator YesN